MPLLDIIKDEIAQQGPMPLPRYMELCLTHPEFGYYTTRDPLGAPKGHGGDFTTAPEITQMFGELIGIWAIHEWHKLGSPARFTLLELGPGRGTLMADLLRITAKVAPDFAEAAQLYLCDASPVLRKAQWEKLGAHSPTWIDDISALPAQPTITIANEFFDALPIAQVRRNDSEWMQKAITLENDQLAFFDIPATDAPRDITSITADGWLEYSPASRDIMFTLSQHIAAYHGAALIIDYGYTTLENVKNCDTLQALHQHKPVSVLDNPGSADLTAHVDFAVLGWCAHNAGINNVMYLTQAELLNALGIVERAEKLNQHAERARLTSPDQMGELFKVLIVASIPKPAT